jgi:hypothetical protein
MAEGKARLAGHRAHDLLRAQRDALEQRAAHVAARRREAQPEEHARGVAVEEGAREARERGHEGDAALGERGALAVEGGVQLCVPATTLHGVMHRCDTRMFDRAAYSWKTPAPRSQLTADAALYLHHECIGATR